VFGVDEEILEVFEIEGCYAQSSVGPELKFYS
jgi:hypothetical protein